MTTASRHYIICGYGPVGRRVADVFRESGVDYVVLDFTRTRLRRHASMASCTSTATGRTTTTWTRWASPGARLVASSDSDVDNLYITSPRRANDLIAVVARASDQMSRKAASAGADRVVQPYSAAGERWGSSSSSRRSLRSWMSASIAGGQDMHFEESAWGGQRCGGKSIDEMRVREHTGALIIALRKRDGTSTRRLIPDAVLEVGDV